MQQPGLSPLAVLIDKFLRTHLPRKTRFLAACSGGPDSVGLVHALAELSIPRGLKVEIGHVNHRLRGRESDADQRFVERLGRSVGWKVNVTASPVTGPGNVEERARDLRHAALARMARQRRSDAILMAHTIGDQAETVFMNLLRGAGLDGLAGMRPVRQDDSLRVTIARPLLSAERADVRAYAKAKGGFRTDRSNADPKFFRNYIRINLFDQLDQRSPGFQYRIARLAELIRDELPILDVLAEKAKDEVGQPYKGGWLLDRRRFEGHPLAVQRRVLRKAAGRDLLTFDGVERLRLWMASPPKNGRIWQLRKGWIVERLSKSGGSPSPAMFWFRQTPATAKRSRTLEFKKGR